MIRYTLYNDLGELLSRETLIMWNQAFGDLSIYELGKEHAHWVEGIYEDYERLEPYDN